MLKRDIQDELIKWQKKPKHMPLLIRGARQVGKSHLVANLQKQHWSSHFTINFEFNPEYKDCFKELDPKKILEKIYLLSQRRIIPGETLLFLDEIQECPNAIVALRYFYEQLPALHVIAAGSLLEFTLRQENLRMPVGRVQSLYMYPLSFKEFLQASGNQGLVDYLHEAHWQQPIENVFHEKLLDLLRQYWLLGGMPAVLDNYFETQDLIDSRNLQSSLLDSYRGDFSKYASHTNVKYLQRLFSRAPNLIAKNFKYVDVDPDMRARELKTALVDLVDAGLLYKVNLSQANSLPLMSSINEKKFKLLFLDIGLACKALGIGADVFLNHDLDLKNLGNIAEQFVGQELQAYASSYEKNYLYYWERNQKSGSAEIDYIGQHNTEFFPIEVKAGASGRLKSLHLFLEQNNAKLGVQVSKKPLGIDGNVLSIPLYMLFELPRLVGEYLHGFRG